MPTIDPSTCDPNAPLYDMYIYADDGVTVLNIITASECMASWACEIMMEGNFYPGNTNLTWVIRNPYPYPES